MLVWRKAPLPDDRERDKGRGSLFSGSRRPYARLLEAGRDSRIRTLSAATPLHPHPTLSRKRAGKGQIPLTRGELLRRRAHSAAARMLAG